MCTQRVSCAYREIRTCMKECIHGCIQRNRVYVQAQVYMKRYKCIQRKIRIFKEAYMFKGDYVCIQRKVYIYIYIYIYMTTCVFREKFAYLERFRYLDKKMYTCFVYLNLYICLYITELMDQMIRIIHINTREAEDVTNYLPCSNLNSFRFSQKEFMR